MALAEKKRLGGVAEGLRGQTHENRQFQARAVNAQRLLRCAAQIKSAGQESLQHHAVEHLVGHAGQAHDQDRVAVNPDGAELLAVEPETEVAQQIPEHRQKSHVGNQVGQENVADPEQRVIYLADNRLQGNQVFALVNVAAEKQEEKVEKNVDADVGHPRHGEAFGLAFKSQPCKRNGHDAINGHHQRQHDDVPFLVRIAQCNGERRGKYYEKKSENPVHHHHRTQNQVVVNLRVFAVGETEKRGFHAECVHHLQKRHVGKQ